MEFLRSKISEVEEKVAHQNTGEDFSRLKMDEMITELQISEQSLSNNSLGEETKSDDDIFSILQRYQHLNSEDINDEPTADENNVDSDIDI